MRSSLLTAAAVALTLAAAGPTTQAPAAAEPDAQARAWWVTNASSILSSLESGRAAGECTAYVAARRPDVVERVDVWAYARRVLVLGRALDVNWAAKNWSVNAQHAGLPTGKVARPGAVIVFQPGAYGANSNGHVAYVDAVGKLGSFIISEMHAPRKGHVTSRHFDAPTARAMSTDPGISFIYKWARISRPGRDQAQPLR